MNMKQVQWWWSLDPCATVYSCRPDKATAFVCVCVYCTIPCVSYSAYVMEGGCRVCLLAHCRRV
uniref:Uncharacterized protein n=1 Tax=Anguilla anguilla TaxID=7936 RepID=A0A0E9PYH0_ANGAN